ncbi:uncharacterized protein LOC135810500 [Sycon ciliatum]|uniref:uncharacterized protein LOC135810500 n=1 Tax=Sycon ciliatum TaxID=27933 RepID=UPI0031F6107C
MASAAGPCFSDDLGDTAPVTTEDVFREFLLSSPMKDAPDNVRENAVELFSLRLGDHSTSLSSPCDTLAAASEQDSARRWLSWARDGENPLHQLIRSNEHEIPDGILPAECRDARLTDFRVQPPKPGKGGQGDRRRRGPLTDDAVYAEHKELRDKLARGNCFLEYSTASAELAPGQATAAADSLDRHQICTVYGLRKFTGGLGDDDNDLVDQPDEEAAAPAGDAAESGGGGAEQEQAPRWANFFSSSLAEVQSVVATSKANGEAAHFAARYLHGRWVLIAGSKNVHVVFSRRRDLGLYKQGQYTVAERVAHAVCDALDKLDSRQCLMFLSFLACTGYTAIFELLQPEYQHVESLSHLLRPQLQFICWSSFMDSFNDVCVGALDPMLCHHMAKAFGLEPVACEDLPLDELDVYLTKVRNDHGHEGNVLYFLNEKRCPVGLLKRKTVWYICIRAIREKTKTALRVLDRREKQKKPAAKGEKAPSQLPSEGHYMRGVYDKITRRFQDIDSWLEFGKDCHRQWLDLALGFVHYVIDHVADGSLPREEVNNRFPDVWNRYLQVSGSTDRIYADIPPCKAAESVFVHKNK